MVQPEQSAAHRNWWKIGFFVAILVLAVVIELAREALLIADNAVPTGPGLSVVNLPGTYVAAEGVWIRPNSDDQLGPNAVQIRCDREEMRCVEAQADMFMSHSLSVQSSDYRISDWTDDSISYAKEDAWCVRYFTRIDLGQQRVTTTRMLRPEKVRDEFCKDTEPELRLELANGYEYANMQNKDVFLPLLKFIFAGLARFARFARTS